jgi:hypothetical protein
MMTIPWSRSGAVRNLLRPDLRRDGKKETLQLEKTSQPFCIIQLPTPQQPKHSSRIFCGWRTIPVLLIPSPFTSARDERAPRVRCRRQLTDPPQDRREQRPWHCLLRHLERDGLRVMHDFRADLDQVHPWRRQRPSFYRPWQRQRTQDVGQVVGQGEDREPRLVVPVPAARQPRPLQKEVEARKTGTVAPVGFSRRLTLALIQKPNFIPTGTSSGESSGTRVNSGLSGSPRTLKRPSVPFSTGAR